MIEVLKKKVEEAKADVQHAWKGVEEAKATAEKDPTDENRAAYQERYGKYDAAIEKMDGLDAELKTEMERAIRRGKTSDSPSPFEAKGGQSPGERITASAFYKAAVSAHSHIPKVQVLTDDEILGKTLVTSEGNPGDQLLVTTRLPGVTSYLRAPLSLLDLFSTGTTDGNAIEYVLEGAGTNNAAVVPEATSASDEAARKPESAMAFSVETATYKTIAHHIPVTRQALEDIGEMQTLINNFLVDGVRRELLDQAINGNDLDGIYDVAGLSAAESSADGALAAIFRGITAVRNAFLEPNAVAINPNDWTRIRLSRNDAGAGAGTGDYLFGPPSQAGADTLWGLRVVVDPAITQGRPIVGKWDEATLYSKGGVSIHSTDSHGTEFTLNIIRILAEGRFMLVTRRPNAFCVVTHDEY